MTENTIEYFLNPEHNRYVMFPIKDNSIGELYKKAEDIIQTLDKEIQDLEEYRGVELDKKIRLGMKGKGANSYHLIMSVLYSIPPNSPGSVFDKNYAKKHYNKYKNIDGNDPLEDFRMLCKKGICDPPDLDLVNELGL